MNNDELRTYLEMMAKIVPNQDKNGFKHASVAHFLLSEAIFCNPIPRDSSIIQGEMKMCFRNAYNLAAANSSYVYVEGYAVSMIPTLHAWCIDENKNVIDPTWTDGTAYFGVPFSLKYVNSVILSRQIWGVIDNWNDRFPLITGEHTDFKDRRFK